MLVSKHGNKTTGAVFEGQISSERKIIVDKSASIRGPTEAGRRVMTTMPLFLFASAAARAARKARMVIL